ncbi:2-succinyl-6-hydroxy-2,4-cyclohexadiene-1-carboxylate synthase [bioreactor metagenome]|uniref:2-succinyl-6-hydroxy-2, 4-cyclohexadiene-1-carboxylate synthase n=1 Tax=bioreactor metagenome TaxID=1076179 RepID=A0A645HRF7_9ZZZZ
MGTLLFRGIEIHYESIGTGKPFLFLHGLGGDSSAVTASYSPPAGIRLITFDFPGHGQSGYSGDDLFSFSTFTELLFALQDSLDLVPCAVGGISMGAAVSLRAALLESKRFTRLILVRPAWLNAPMEQNVQHVYAEIACFLRMDNGLNSYRSSTLSRTLSAEYPALESSMLGLLSYPRGAETAGNDCFGDC